ncbi:MAG: LacI family transcriptional regulator [Firmicutes bacterium]|jgi:DNA-binding LacI/PurR family transcriptional regulator|nr:LacI family transcriptional regulator [Bacillota bacterium]
MVTLKDIAEATSLSISTVSRVLSGTADQVGIAEETQKRVWEAAHKLNYQPNMTARNLKLGYHPKCVLFLYHELVEGGGEQLLVHPFFSHMLRGIHLRVAENKDYYLAYFGADEEDKDQLVQLLEQTANGVITFGALPESIWEKLASQEKPVVSIEPYTFQAEYSIYVNNHLAISQAVGYLRSLGHRRICFFFTPDANEAGGPMLERLEAFQKEVSAAGFDVAATVKYIPLEGNLVEAGVKAALEVLNSPERPTAILTCHDLYGIGALEAARRMEVRVPQELSVVGIDDIDWASYTYPPLTTIEIPKEELGFAAASMLMGLIQGKPCEQPLLRLPTRLIERGSAGSSTLV